MSQNLDSKIRNC